MPSPIEFYFDFSSPYGYIGATRITTLAARYGRTVQWKPMLLGAVFKVTGSGPLPSLPLKGDYALRDMPRTARFHGVPFNMPATFPIATQAPARAICWLEEKAPEKVEAAVLALYRAYFVDGVDISSPVATAEVLGGLGVDAAALQAALNDPAVKERLWGTDRFEQIERWLSQGGF
jgi:2-hydroxychromene-2-carboxylate isomerase